MTDYRRTYVTHHELLVIKSEIMEYIKDIKNYNDQLNGTINNLVMKLNEASRDNKDINKNIENLNSKLFNLEGHVSDITRDKIKYEAKWELIHSIVDFKSASKFFGKIFLYFVFMSLVSVGASDFFHYIKLTIKHYYNL